MPVLRATGRCCCGFGATATLTLMLRVATPVALPPRALLAAGAVIGGGAVAVATLGRSARVDLEWHCRVLRRNGVGFGAQLGVRVGHYVCGVQSVSELRVKKDEEFIIYVLRIKDEDEDQLKEVEKVEEEEEEEEEEKESIKEVVEEKNVNSLLKDADDISKEMEALDF